MANRPIYGRNPKVLLVCTLNPAEKNLHTEELTLNAQQPSIFLETLNTIQEIGWSGVLDSVYMREDKVRESGYKNNLKKMNQARKLCLEGDYDYLFAVEADMIIPKTALERLHLVLRDADIAYGFYCSRHSSRRWLIFDEEGLEMSESLRKKVLANWGKVIPSWGMGFGCTLIKRKVLEEISFRIEEKGAAADAYFARDARVKGFVQKHDLGVICGHITQPYPLQVVYPDNQPPYFTLWQRKRRFEMGESKNGKYITLKPLTFPDRTVRVGEAVILTTEQATVLLARQAVEPAEGDFSKTFENPPVIEEVLERKEETQEE